MLRRVAAFCFMAGVIPVLAAQDSPPQTTPDPTPASPQEGGFKPREQPPTEAGVYRIETGTRVLLNMINSVSTKQAQVGDRIYLETAFPIMSQGKIVIPQGSWVTGTITEVKRPGRVKGRGELQVRFDSLTLANGTSRNFKSDLGALDARNQETLKREQSKVGGAGDKKTDAETIEHTTLGGAAAGSAIGAATGNWGRGAGIGLGAGAAAGIAAVLLTRGPDAMLTKGSTVEMVLDRPLTFSNQDLNFSGAPPSRGLSEGSPPAPRSRGWDTKY